MKHYTFENAAVTLGGLDATLEFLGPIFTEREQELLIIALCDDHLRLIQLLSIPGTEALVRFSLAEIIGAAVCIECAGIVLAHNHPSADTRPSKADLAFTRNLSLAAEALGISVLDHLIFNDCGVISLRQRGLL